MAKQIKNIAAEQSNGSSLASKKVKQEVPALPSTPVDFDGKKYLPLVHAIIHDGKKYSAEEFMADAEVMKFLVEHTFNKAGVSLYLKEVF